MSVRLTDLPVEVLQEIFLYLDPHSFYRVGLSCRRVRQLTLGSEFLLRQQVKSLPGPEQDLDHVPFFMRLLQTRQDIAHAATVAEASAPLPLQL